MKTPRKNRPISFSRRSTGPGHGFPPATTHRRITEQFDHFLKDLKESFWGDLYGQTRLAWKKFWDTQSLRERDFNAGGELDDTRDVKLGMTAASAFAYVADGKNRLRIVQIFSPNDTPTYLGFSPRPSPKLIATYHTRGAAVSVSKGVDRDRAVDESGNQLAVFNRRGSRPFNAEEMERMYMRNGHLYTVTNTPLTAPGADTQPRSHLAVSK